MLFDRQDSTSDDMEQVDQNYVMTLKAMLQDKDVFPTTGNKWLTSAEKPLIVDDKHLAELFEDKHKYIINFLDLDEQVLGKYEFVIFPSGVSRVFGWLCFTSHRQRGHLETAPPFTVPCEGREAR